MEIDHLSAAQTPEISQYEQSRELRIKENLERMHKLGIVDLSLKLKSSAPSKQTRRKSLNPKASPPPFDLPLAGPVRRSSRLQNATPVTYYELRLERKNKFSEDEGVILEDGSRPEIYSEEHEKRLGSTEKSWTLFVDGYGNDGKRIYDRVKGKSCHQCRQKTLGHRTHCIKCNMAQGQFCGDCLYMRYGEHVLEAQQNPDWICPVCRGICNCSLCRQAKGWFPTGSLYKKITRMGFKSVAHFLIETKRSQPSSGQNPTDLASAKRSLSFTDFEVNPAGSPKVNDNLLETMEQHFENNAVDKSENEKRNILQSVSDYETKDHISVKRSLSFSCMEQQGSKETNPPNQELSQLQSANYELSEDVINEKEKELRCLKRKNGDNYSPSDGCPMPEKKPTTAVESNTVDLGCSTGNDHSEKKLSGVQARALSTDQCLEKKTDISSRQTRSECTTGETNPPNQELSQLQSANYELSEDVINEKEKELRCLKRKNGDNYSPSDGCPMPEKKPTTAVESNTVDLGCSTGNDHSEKELSGVQAMALSTDQCLEKKTDISSRQTSSECTTGETNPPNQELSQLQSANYELSEDVINEKEKELRCLKRKNGDNYSPSDGCPMPEKKPTTAVESNTVDLGCSTGNDHSEKELPGVQAMALSTDQCLEKKTDISSRQTSSECTTGEHGLEGGVFQESNGKTSEEGANSLSKKKTKARAKLSTSSELKSVSSSRVLRSRHKTT